MALFTPRRVRIALAAFIAATLSVQPVMAQSILRDAETEAFFQEISEPRPEQCRHRADQ
jgi:hypothetical protein